VRKTLGVALLASVLAACGQKSAEEHYQLAQQALEQGGKETAVIELKNAIRMAPNNAQYRYLLGHFSLQDLQMMFVVLLKISFLKRCLSSSRPDTWPWRRSWSPRTGGTPA